jgi:hypothetical protein
MSRIGFTTEQFINKSKEKFGTKFCYEDTHYTNSGTHVIITCPDHGKFEIRPWVHLSGAGCPGCSRALNGLNHRMDTSTFIQRARNKHNNFYDYSKTVFEGSLKNLVVTCPMHGDFVTLASRHINNGHGCPKCSLAKRIEKNATPVSVFLEEISKKPNFEYYDFSKLIRFKNKKEWVTVFCKKHGEFKTKPRYIETSMFFGCSKCKKEDNKFNTSIFIEKAKEQHGECYSYDNVEYVDSHTDVLITCRTHGDFMCKPYVHLAGGGFCCRCTSGVSSYEFEIRNLLESNNVPVESQFRRFKGIKEIDIISHENKIGIEFNGLYWHRSDIKGKDYHKNKTDKMLEYGYRLIHIFEDDWLFKKEICKSIILNAFSKTPKKIHARKCEIKPVSNKDACKFLIENHIQGHCVSKVRYGLFFKNELVSVMTFGSNRKNLGNVAKPNEYELLRFCNKIYTNVVGGASRLFKFFIQQHTPQKITSYCNRGTGTGNLYKQLGFCFLYNTPPNYFYFNRNKRLSRFKFRKDVLIKQGYDKFKTEACIMEELGYHRIHDCGSMKFQWFNQSFSEDDLF